MARTHGLVLPVTLASQLLAAFALMAPAAAGDPAPGDPVAPTPSLPLACSVTAVTASGMLRIRAAATAAAATRGRYALAIAKDNAAGSAQTLQSGEVNLAAGEERELSTVAVEASAVGHVKARLALDTEAGRVTCSYP